MTGHNLAKIIRAHPGAVSAMVMLRYGEINWLPLSKEPLAEWLEEEYGERETHLTMQVSAGGDAFVGSLGDVEDIMSSMALNADSDRPTQSRSAA